MADSKREQQAKALAVRCDYCGAEPGRRCTSTSGFSFGAPHAARVRAYHDREEETR